MTDSKQQTPFTASSAMRLIFETTLRLAVPAIGGTILGVWADNAFDTKPWLTVIGVTLGAAAAVWLVAKQIKKVTGA